MIKRKVAIIGTGCVTPLGNSVEEYYNSLNQLFENNQRTFKSAYSALKVNNFSYSDKKISVKYAYIDRACGYVLKAVDEALRSDKIDLEKLKKDNRISVIIGTTFGVTDTQIRYIDKLYEAGKASPMLFQHTANNLLSGIITYKYEINGFNMTIFNGWTASIDAISLAADLIENNNSDIVIAGAVDVVNEYTLNYYSKIKNTVENKITAGEGSGIVILEDYKKALRLNHHIKGFLLSESQENLVNEKSLYQYILNCLDKNNIDLYFSNLGGTIYESCEKSVLESKNIMNNYPIKEFIGQSASVGILELIYAVSLKSENLCLILNITGSGRVSSVIVQGGYNDV